MAGACPPVPPSPRRTHARAPPGQRHRSAAEQLLRRDRRRDGREPGRPVSAAGTGRGTGDPDAIKADIDATREQLGRTVDQLAYRLDVPARARDRATEYVLRARDT